MATAAQNKARLIRLIHVARRDLAMADDTYRAILKDLTGHASSKDCNGWQLEKVVDHMKRAGFKVRAPSKSAAATGRSLAHGGRYSKVRAVWLQLHAWGGIDNPSEAALAAYVKRQAGVDDMRWADLPRGHGIKILEGLKKWAARVGLERLRERWARIANAGAVTPGDLALRAWIRTVSHSDKALGVLPYDAIAAAMVAIEQLPAWNAIQEQEPRRDAA